MVQLERGGQKCVILEETKYILSQYIVLFKYDSLLLDIDYLILYSNREVTQKRNFKGFDFSLFFTQVSYCWLNSQTGVHFKEDKILWSKINTYKVLRKYSVPD